MIKKINKRLGLSPRRAREFYSNILAGIMTGGILGVFLSLMQIYSDLEYQTPSLFSILVFALMFIFLYNYGMRSLIKMNSSTQELKNYRSNVQAGFFASLFAILVLVFQNLWARLLIIIPLTLIFILLLYLIFGRKRSK